MKTTYAMDLMSTNFPIDQDIKAKACEPWEGVSKEESECFVGVLGQESEQGDLEVVILWS